MDHCLIFIAAIENGQLSNNPKDDNYAGHYIYMGDGTFKKVVV